MAQFAAAARYPIATNSLTHSPAKTGAPSQQAAAESPTHAEATTELQTTGDAAASDGRLLRVASRIAADYRDSAASRLNDVGDRLADVAAWSRSVIPDPDAIPAAAPQQQRETPTPSPAHNAPQDRVHDVSQPNDIVVLNPARSGGTVQFLVDGEVVSLRPGESRTFDPLGIRLVQFDRGKDFGVAELAITEAGIYAFRVTSSGWALNKVSSPNTL